MPAHEIVEKLVDKSRFAIFAEELALPVPKTLAGTSETTLDEIARRIGFPCVLKTCHAHITVAERAQIARARKARPIVCSAPNARWIFRRCSSECGIGRRRSSFKNGSPAARSRFEAFTSMFAPTGRRSGTTSVAEFALINVAAARTPSSSSSAIPSSITASAWILTVRRIGLVGVAKLDFKLDPRTLTYHLLDVSPRFNRWNHLGAVSGVNLPFIAYRDLTGAPAEPRAEATAGPRWLSFGDEARAFLRDYAPEGDLPALDWLRSYRGGKVYDVFAWDDPSPFVMHCLHALRQRARGART